MVLMYELQYFGVVQELVVEASVNVPVPDRPRQGRAKRYEIDSVANAIDLLDRIANKGFVSLADAADVTGVSKSSAYRLLATLEVAGLVERIPGSGYRAGAGAIRWAAQLLGNVEIRVVALPILRRLRDETGETVNLALLRDAGLVYVEILESPSPLRMADAPGSAAPMHASALGKAIAMYLPPARLSMLLGPEPYQRFTPNTATSWRDLSLRLVDVRARGYSVDLEEVSDGVACAAAAILSGGEVVAAMSISGPRSRMSDAALERAGQSLVHAAASVAGLISPEA